MKIKMCAVLGLVAGLVGCASRLPPVSLMNNINLGMTEAEVKGVLGEPKRKTVKFDGPTCLEYRLFERRMGLNDFDTNQGIILKDGRVVQTGAGGC